MKKEGGTWLNEQVKLYVLFALTFAATRIFFEETNLPPSNQTYLRSFKDAISARVGLPVNSPVELSQLELNLRKASDAQKLEKAMKAEIGTSLVDQIINKLKADSSRPFYDNFSNRTTVVPAGYDYTWQRDYRRISLDLNEHAGELPVYILPLGIINEDLSGNPLEEKFRFVTDNTGTDILLNTGGFDTSDRKNQVAKLMRLAPVIIKEGKSLHWDVSPQERNTVASIKADTFKFDSSNSGKIMKRVEYTLSSRLNGVFVEVNSTYKTLSN